MVSIQYLKNSGAKERTESEGDLVMETRGLELLAKRPQECPFAWNGDGVGSAAVEGHAFETPW